MWPWTRKQASDPPATVARRLDDLDADFRRLKGEWLDTLDRLERLAGRLAKRAERDGTAHLSPPDGAGADPAPPASRAMAEVLKRRAPRG